MFVQTSRLAVISTVLMTATSSLALPFYQDARAFDDLEAPVYARAGSCFKLSKERAERIPGWSKVIAYRDEHWGPKGGLQVNPSEYPEREAIVCLEAGEVKAHWEGAPTCSEDSMNLGGTSVGTDSTVTNGREATTETKATWTVTKSSEFSMGTEFSVGIGSEATGQVGAKFSTSLTLRDESTSSTESTSSSKQMINVEFNNADGKDCKAHLIVKTCNGKSTARVPATVTGYVWFNYDKAVPDKTKPGSSKHYHWSVNLNKVLSVEERTRYIELVGSVKMVTHGDYKTDCTLKPPGSQKSAAKSLTAKSSKSPSAMGADGDKVNKESNKATRKAGATAQGATGQGQQRPLSSRSRPSGSPRRRR